MKHRVTGVVAKFLIQAPFYMCVSYHGAVRTKEVIMVSGNCNVENFDGLYFNTLVENHSSLDMVNVTWFMSPVQSNRSTLFLGS